MYTKHMGNYLNAVIEDIENSKDKDIKSALSKIRKNIGEKDALEYLVHAVEFVTAETLTYNGGEEEFLLALKENLADGVEMTKWMTKTYTFHVELADHKEVYRDIVMPSAFSLADTAYAILAAFGLEAEHEFLFVHKGERFYSQGMPLYDEGDYYANETILYHLNLRKNSHFTFVYDLGDSWEFNITLLEKEELGKLVRMDEMKVVSGAGADLWEDDKYLFDLALDDPQEFKKLVKENELDEELFTLDNDFDLDSTNDLLIEGFFTMKTAYESGDHHFYEEDEEDDWESYN